ncbi:MAG: hypothetical protein HG457_003370 [Flavobacteriaceae bacterium]|nr:hypothetical protein [Flavobacteriaceae bacterium]
MIKKLGIIFTIGVVILGIVVYAGHKIERSWIEGEFGVDMSNMNIDEKYREEEWAPNGDGEKTIILTYDQLDSSFMKLNKLPIKEDLPPNGIPKQFLNITNGYYKYVVNENDDRDFGILIVDTTRKEICIYNQIF